MEVLISIGILSVGLASVVALIPAGGSLAKKTVIEDRRGAMASAAIADVVNYGMLNPATWSAGAAPYRVIIDPIGSASFTGLTSVNVSNIAAGSSVANLVFSAADDLVYKDNPAAGDPTSDPPISRLTSDSARRFAEGGYSWLATLVPSGTSATPQFYTLSVVEFYRRPPAGTGLSVSTTGSFPNMSSISLSGIGSFNLAINDFRAVFPQGGALLFTDGSTIHAWRRIQLASPIYSGDTIAGANIALDRETPDSTSDFTVYALEGTVGVVERGVQLEGPSPWAR